MFEAPEGAAVKPPAIFQLIITILLEAFFSDGMQRMSFAISLC